MLCLQYVCMLCLQYVYAVFTVCVCCVYSMHILCLQYVIFLYAVFLTGSDRIPILGMKAVKMIIQPTHGGNDYLPVAHTCFNLLDLPKYQDVQTMKEKLCMAIEQTEGFGIVWSLHTRILKIFTVIPSTWNMHQCTGGSYFRRFTIWMNN